MPAHARAQDGFEHVLLESANDWVLVQQVQGWGMTFQNLRRAVSGDELRHVAFSITDVREPLGAFRYSVSLGLGFERCRFLFENVVKQFLRRVWAVDFLGRFQ